MKPKIQEASSCVRNEVLRRDFSSESLQFKKKDDGGNLLECDWINTKYDTRQRSNLVVRSTDQLRFIKKQFFNTKTWQRERDIFLIIFEEKKHLKPENGLVNKLHQGPIRICYLQLGKSLGDWKLRNSFSIIIMHTSEPHTFPESSLPEGLFQMYL